jgi:hypothetical protein
MTAERYDGMQLISQGPVRLEFKSSNTGAGLFLMFFSLLWGGMPALVLISMLGSGKANGPWPMLLIFPLVGSGLFLLGLSMLSSHIRVILDRESGKILVSRNSLITREAEEHAFSEIKEVLYHTETRTRPKGGSYQVWSASIKDRHDNLLSLGAQITEEPIRARAEILSRFLNVPMRDISAGEESLRMPEDLDRPLVEAMNLSGEEIWIELEPPEGSKIIVERTPGFIRYTFPSPGISLASGCSGIFMIIWLSFALFWTSTVFTSTFSSKQPGTCFISLCGLPFIIIGLIFLIFIARDALAKKEITVTPETLTHRNLLGGLSAGSVSIPLNQIEEVTPGVRQPLTTDSELKVPAGLSSLFLTGSQAVRIVSDKVIIRAGNELSPQESEWFFKSLRAEIFRYGEKTSRS